MLSIWVRVLAEKMIQITHPILGLSKWVLRECSSDLGIPNLLSGAPTLGQPIVKLTGYHQRQRFVSSASEWVRAIG